jgi:hypothetical protein
VSGTNDRAARANAASGQSAAAAAASKQARKNRNTMLVAGHAVEQGSSDVVTSISTTNQVIIAKMQTAFRLSYNLSALVVK